MVRRKRFGKNGHFIYFKDAYYLRSLCRIAWILIFLKIVCIKLPLCKIWCFLPEVSIFFTYPLHYWAHLYDSLTCSVDSRTIQEPVWITCKRGSVTLYRVPMHCVCTALFNFIECRQIEEKPGSEVIDGISTMLVLNPPSCKS